MTIGNWNTNIKETSNSINTYSELMRVWTILILTEIPIQIKDRNKTQKLRKVHNNLMLIDINILLENLID